MEHIPSTSLDRSKTFPRGRQVGLNFSMREPTSASSSWTQTVVTFSCTMTTWWKRRWPRTYCFDLNITTRSFSHSSSWPTTGSTTWAGRPWTFNFSWSNHPSLLHPLLQELPSCPRTLVTNTSEYKTERTNQNIATESTLSAETSRCL